MQFETGPGLMLFHRVGNQTDVLLALNMQPCVGVYIYIHDYQTMCTSTNVYVCIYIYRYHIHMIYHNIYKYIYI